MTNKSVDSLIWETYAGSVVSEQTDAFVDIDDLISTSQFKVNGQYAISDIEESIDNTFSGSITKRDETYIDDDGKQHKAVIFFADNSPIAVYVYPTTEDGSGIAHIFSSQQLKNEQPDGSWA